MSESDVVDSNVQQSRVVDSDVAYFSDVVSGARRGARTASSSRFVQQEAVQICVDRFASRHAVGRASSIANPEAWAFRVALNAAKRVGSVSDAKRADDIGAPAIATMVTPAIMERYLAGAPRMTRRRFRVLSNYDSTDSLTSNANRLGTTPFSLRRMLRRALQWSSQQLAHDDWNSSP